MERLIRKTTAQQVAETVEVAILAGEFDRGGRLPPERKLAAMLGVSRPTLREGLNRLVARGILMPVPGLGTFVSSFEMTQSIDHLEAEYLMERVPKRKVALVRHYLETRRFLLSTVLGAAAERATDDQIEWIIDGFVRMASTAQFTRDLRKTAEMEIRAIHIAAEKADLYHLWLMLNSLRHFFRAARDEIVAGARLDDFDKRGHDLVQLLRRRDSEGIRRYVATEYGPADRAQLAALERRLLKRNTGTGASTPSRARSAPTSDADSPPTTSVTRPITSPDKSNRSGVTVERDLRASDPRTVGDTRPPDVHTTAAGDSESAALPRTDPASWHRWFIDWYQRNFQCNPWDNPDEIPPGPTIDDEPPPRPDEHSSAASALESGSAGDAPPPELRIASAADIQDGSARALDENWRDPAPSARALRPSAGFSPELGGPPKSASVPRAAGGESVLVEARPDSTDPEPARNTSPSDASLAIPADHAAASPVCVFNEQRPVATPRPRERDSP